MTEAEWLSCNDPRRMFTWMSNPAQIIPGLPPSERKARLLCSAFLENSNQEINWKFSYGKDGELVDRPTEVVEMWCNRVEDAYRYDPSPELKCHLIRDVIGNPFRPVKLSRSGLLTSEVRKAQANAIVGCCNRFADYQSCDCLALSGDVLPQWLTPTVRAIAQRIYDELDWEAMPILADALEDAGCEAEERCLECAGYSQRGKTLTSSSAYEAKWQTCAQCRGTCKVSNPLLAHLRAPCPYCKDAAPQLTDESLLDLWPTVIAAIKRDCICKGTRLALHVRGCWVIDLLTGRR